MSRAPRTWDVDADVVRAWVERTLGDPALLEEYAAGMYRRSMRPGYFERGGLFFRDLPEDARARWIAEARADLEGRVGR